jgi:hypothetical protein
MNHAASDGRKILLGRKRFLKYILLFSTILGVTVPFALFEGVSYGHTDLQLPEPRRLRDAGIKKDCSASGLLGSTSEQIRLRSPPPTHKKKPCALLFFGLAKQFRSITLPSIKEHILNVPEHAQCDIYAHNYDITNVTEGTHVEESDVTFDPKEIYDLTSNVVMDTNEDFLAKRNMKFLTQRIFVPTKQMGWVSHFESKVARRTNMIILTGPSLPYYLSVEWQVSHEHV